MRVISNSEVGAFLSCERKHYYSFILNLAPKRLSQSLSRGVLGHEMLAAYYESLKQGKSEDVARRTARSTAEVKLLEDDADVPMIAALVKLVDDYLTYTNNNGAMEDIEILEVEKFYQVPLSDEYAYGMRLDLLVKHLGGQFQGEDVVWDHKFVYNFWNQDAVNLNSQIPKYIATLRYHGHNVYRGLFNQIRWRDKKSAPYTDEEKFQKYPFRPSPNKIRRVFEEQIRAAERIVERYKQDPQLVGRNSLRVMNQLVCNNCPFKYICDTDLNGDDTTLMMQTEFSRNEYNETYQALVIDDELV